MFLALVKTHLILTIELIFRILQQTGRQAMVRVTRKVLPASWSGQHSCWHGLNFSGQAPITEGWPSGLRRTPGKRVGVKAPPGFESPSLRHICSAASKASASLSQASASITIPAATMLAAIRRGRAGPSPNQIRPIIAAKITDVSRSADTMPSGALLLA